MLNKLDVDKSKVFNCDEIDNFIECLVKSEIDNLVLVIATRYINLSNLEELNLKGYLNHIVKEDLEFTTDEIAHYYKLCGIKLTDSGAETLYKNTEGWISALYLQRFYPRTS